MTSGGLKSLYARNFIGGLIHGVAGSMARVAFNDIFGRSVRPAVRGTFFASRQFLGSILAFSAGYITRAILRRPDLAFPHNYACLFILAGFSLAIGAVGFALFQEPPLENPPPLRAARDYFREDHCPSLPGSRLGQVFTHFNCWAQGTV